MGINCDQFMILGWAIAHPCVCVVPTLLGEEYNSLDEALINEDVTHKFH